VFLAAFSGLYFTVYVVTDESYRVQFFTGVLREMEKAVAVRTVYRHLCRRRDAEGGAVDTTSAPDATLPPEPLEDAVPTRTLPAAAPGDPGTDPGNDPANS
jgi:cell wall assembly regulator SMI1